jgi:hypothetical protein
VLSRDFLSAAVLQMDQIVNIDQLNWSVLAIEINQETIVYYPICNNPNTSLRLWMDGTLEPDLSSQLK